MSRILAATIGRLSPRYRTLADWAETYRKALAARPISQKTLCNRNSALGHVVAALGHRTLGRIRPHEIAELVRELHARYPQAAKRALQECRELFNEAVNYGWIDRNPALTVKQLPAGVRRKRLTLEQWIMIHEYARRRLPPWVSRMMTLALVTGQRRSDLAALRFDAVWDGHLHVQQIKTGARLALPLELRLAAIGVSIADVIEDCRGYAVPGPTLLRKHNGRPPCLASLSARFEEAREAVIAGPREGLPPSLHECRSLAERLYRAQGIDTRVLLGHRHQSMTDLYHDDRGLSRGEWITLRL